MITKKRSKAFDWKRGLVGVLFLAVVGGLGLGYCEVVYRNGADPLKDGGLIALVGGLVGFWMKFAGGSAR